MLVFQIAQDRNTIDPGVQKSSIPDVLDIFMYLFIISKSTVRPLNMDQIDFSNLRLMGGAVCKSRDAAAISCLHSSLRFPLRALAKALCSCFFRRVKRRPVLRLPNFMSPPR